MTDLYRRYGALPPWIRVATLAAAGVVVLGVLLVSTGGSQVPDDDPGRDAAPAESVSTSTTGVPPSTVGGSDTPVPATSATTAAVPASAAPTTTTAAVSPTDPLALCSPGQRTAIERAKHPWEWYVARYDSDGNGVLCD